MKKIYLASPYSHKDPKVMEARFEAVCKKAAELMQAGHVIFSPIAHSHPISKYIGNPTDTDFYLKQDLALLSMFDAVWILLLDGWRDSEGVRAEAWKALGLGMPVKWIDP